MEFLHTKVKNFYELVANGIRNMILLVSNNYIVRMFNQLYSFLGLKLITLLEWYYMVIARRPMYLSIALLCFSAGVMALISIVVWCIIYACCLGAPSVALSMPIFDFTVYTIDAWIGLYRVAWLVAAAEYGPPGPVPASFLYWNTFKYTSLYFPQIVVFNILLIWYMVLFGQCFIIMLKALLVQKSTIQIKINAWHTRLWMLILTLVLILCVWCPPLLGFGVPTDYETGDPLNPIAWGSAGRAMQAADFE